MSSDQIFDPERTALLLVDLQVGVTDGSLGPVVPHGADTVMANAVALADAFRTASRPVVLLRVDYGPDLALQVRVPNDWNMSFEPAAGWDAFDPRLEPEPGDIVVTKRSYGGFHGTDLDIQLRRRGIDTVVVGGIATNQGVESTVRGAVDHGYRQVFAEDAMGAFLEEHHTYPIGQIFPLYGHVRDTATIIAHLRGEA